MGSELAPKTGVLLINTGTADAPTEDAVRAYLAEFLMDPVLFKAPKFVWKHIVNHAILPNRPKRTLWRYRAIWTDGGSRFMLASQAQRDAVERELENRAYAGGNFEVVLAMRYGNPSIMGALHELRARGCARVVCVPLYPQYVTVCAGTCFAETERCLEELQREGWRPEYVKVPQFYEQKAYIRASAQHIRSRWKYQAGSKLLFSWHSTLMADLEAGDPYREQCEATAAAIAAELGVAEQDWMIAYQSRFDSRKWLQPFCDDVVEQIAISGVKDLCVHCPGFTADNIENVTETGGDLRTMFETRAGEEACYTFVPALNDAPGLIEAVCNAIEQASA